MKKVAIYARYSSDLQNPRSIDDQVRICRERATREGWSVYRCYSDRAISGTVMERPGLQDMLQDARAAKFHIILAEALDRLSRDQADIATMFKRMKFAGIEIVTLSEGRVGILDIALRGTMNQLFSIETANKVRRGQIGRIKEGRPAGARRYGYDIVRSFNAKGELLRGERRINEREAQVIRRIYREYAAGRSPRAIAHRLNKDGVPGPVAKPWTAHSISGDARVGAGILNNEIYIGVFVYNRRSYLKHPETGKKVYRNNPQSEWIRGQAPNMRIIDQRLWEKVRDRRQERSCPRLAAQLVERTDTLRARRSKFLLSGLVKCGCCGSSFVMRRHDRLSCLTSHQRGTCKNRLQIRRKVLEDKVLGALKRHLTAEPERFAAFCEAYARQLQDIRTERAELTKAYRSELGRIESEYDQLTDTPKRAKLQPILEVALKGLTVRHRKLTLELDRLLKSPEPLERHYGDYVNDLVDLTSRTRHYQASYESFRSHLGRVVVRPNDDGTALLVEVACHQRAGRGNANIEVPQQVEPVADS